MLHELKRDMVLADGKQGDLVLVGQHAISTTIAPLLIKTVGDQNQSRIRLRSANREDCLSLLMTRQVDIALLYQLDEIQQEQQEQFVDTHPLGQELLVPVVASNQKSKFKKEWKDGSIRIIAYPRSVFLGDVQHRKLLAQISNEINIHWITETALTSAALQLTLAGNGVAWVPLTLASSAIERGELTRLDSALPSEAMFIVALKLVQQEKPRVISAWQTIQSGRTTLSD